VTSEYGEKIDVLARVKRVVDALDVLEKHRSQLPAEVNSAFGVIADEMSWVVEQRMKDRLGLKLLVELLAFVRSSDVLARMSSEQRTTLLRIMQTSMAALDPMTPPNLSVKR